MAECKGCKHGIKMCENRPCWGTPDEIDYLMDHGEVDFMLDWWDSEAIFNDEGEIDGYTDRIDILAPAIEDYIGYRAPSEPFGRCVFLVDNLCYIHAVHGYDNKPIEGRESCCKTEHIGMHEDVARMWNTPKGKEVVKKWKTKNGLRY